MYFCIDKLYLLFQSYLNQNQIRIRTNNNDMIFFFWIQTQIGCPPLLIHKFRFGQKSLAWNSRMEPPLISFTIFTITRILRQPWTHLRLSSKYLRQHYYHSNFKTCPMLLTTYQVCNEKKIYCKINTWMYGRCY